jgi:hypothetical protein
MGDQSPKMGKKFFGYDSASVERMLLERDAMLKVAERRVQSAESRAVQLEERLAALERVAKEGGTFGPAPVAIPVAVPVPAPPVQEVPRAVPVEQVPQELAKAVSAAETSASQIIEAWTSTREQIVQADKLWRAVQEEVLRFGEWREDVQPMMDLVQSFIEDARARIEEVPGRVQHALAPAVDAMVSVSEGVSRFAAVSTIPLMPSSLRTAMQSRMRESELLDGSEESDDSQETDEDDELTAGLAPLPRSAVHSGIHSNEPVEDDEIEAGEIEAGEDPMAHVLAEQSNRWRHSKDGEVAPHEAAQVDQLTEAAVAHRAHEGIPMEYFES